MAPFRTRLLALAATVALVVAIPAGSAPAARAQAVPGVPGDGGPCLGSISPSGLGDAGATFNQVCGGGVAFIGPAIGQIGTVVGPTIIGSVVNAPITSSNAPIGAGTTGP